MSPTPAPARSTGTDIEAIARRLAELRAASGACLSSAGGAAAGPSAVDAIVSGKRLEAGRVHEWLGVAEPEVTASGDHARRSAWSPALTLLIDMATRELTAAEDGRDRLVWIGEDVWPYPAALVGIAGASVLARSIFVHARRPSDRLWAADLALRSRAAASVIVDGSGLDLASTRRLQLAAEAGKGGGGGGVCLLARPAWERTVLSAAATRWLVSSTPSPSMNRRWTVELLRCKGLQPTAGAPRAWIVERDRATRSVRVVADVLDRPGETQTDRTLPVRRTG